MSPQIAYRRAAAVVARAYGCSICEIEQPRGRARRQARLVAAYLAVTASNQSIRSVARVVGVDHRAIGRGMARIEDRRDVASEDFRLAQLEDAIHAA